MVNPIGKNGFSDPEMVVLSKRSPPGRSPAGKLIIKSDSTTRGAPLFINYGIEEGLPMSSVICSARAKDGSLWFGTAGGGISNYDGKSFTNYTVMNGLPNNTIFYIMEDTGGNLWVGTSTGVSRFNGKSFTNYSIAQGLAGNYVSCIFQDAQGNIWFGTHDGGISAFNGKNFTSYNTGNGLASNYVICGMQDKNHNLWFGTNGGLSLYDGKTFRNYTVADGLVNNKVNGIVQDVAGNIWCATSGGVSEFDGKKFKNFTTLQGLPDNNITCLVQDRAGTIWFGSRLKGISKLDEQGFSNYSMVQGLSDNNISSLLLDGSGNLWFTSLSGGGVNRYQGKAITSYRPGGSYSGSFTSTITQDKSGDIWFGTFEEGVGKYDGKHFSHFENSPGLSDDIIWRSAYDQRGNLWLGSERNGAIKYDGNEVTRYTTAQGLPANTVFCVMQDTRGNLWFATNAGVSEFDGKKMRTYSIAEGLPDVCAGALAEDRERNIIWIGTNRGLCALDEATTNDADGRHPIEVFNHNTGYAIEGITRYSLFVDHSGLLWAGSGHNLISLNYPEINKKNMAPLHLVLKTIEINNEQVCWNCLTRSQSPSGKTDSLVLQNSMIENFGKILGTEEFDSMVVKYHDLKFDSVTPFHAIPAKLILPFHDNSISIDFVAIDPVMPRQVKYQYKLEGYSKEWAQSGNYTTAVFQNIPEGDYVFKVRARSAAGVWSESSYSFLVLAPWWRTWWAYVCYIFAVVGLMYAIFRYRIKNIEHDQSEQLNIMVATQEQERRRISRDLHDDVGIKLSALKLYLSSLHEKSSETKNEAMASLTQNSEKLIGDVMNDVRQLLHNLSPMVLDEFGFIEALQGITDKINEAGQMHIQLIAFGMQQRLPKDYELALYRITQELINNVLKHANAKKVTLQIGQRNHALIIMMEDDGVGFNTENQRDGYGLHNLAARTKLMKGVLKIDSQPGKGTSVYIEIPFNFN